MTRHADTPTHQPVRHLYIHIPFCPAKCAYCAFVTHVGSLRLVQPYVDALTIEIERLARSERPGPLHTVYLGGGTPSMLSPAQLDQILRAVDRTLSVATSAEVTVEAHPQTVDEAKLRGFREAGATRLSFGGESLDTGELAEIGRTHSPERVLAALSDARRAGFENVNVDLMYGLPGQTVASWQNTLSTLVEAAPEHVSLYPLSIEPRTIFAKRFAAGRLHLPADDAVVQMYHRACATLAAAGYKHYEVANWGIRGHQSRHNLAYWRNREFHAVGVGAHGYLHPYRTENVRQTGRYIERIREGEPATELREYVNDVARLGETVTLALRLLREGLDLRSITERFGLAATAAVDAEATPLIREGFLRRVGTRLLLAEDAVPIANEVWERFINLDVSVVRSAQTQMSTDAAVQTDAVGCRRRAVVT